MLGMIPWLDEEVNEVLQVGVALPFCAGQASDKVSVCYLEE